MATLLGSEQASTLFYNQYTAQGGILLIQHYQLPRWQYDASSYYRQGDKNYSTACSSKRPQATHPEVRKNSFLKVVVVVYQVGCPWEMLALTALFRDISSADN
ncbi:hypothetical protein TWF102_009008 [Orbilia oligospora]|uniref:Uncharacterized protein n=1 Tax=Orbilia oligospora TaxID=2813651 RepID=A0A7C8NLX9_ORBOL|nr:hypothetical protein TWF102_009008 [Orbilia oligospora]KAF3144948.1 hypothetical protein TWF594_004530 [Orbilia oligospora]